MSFRRTLTVEWPMDAEVAEVAEMPWVKRQEWTDPMVDHMLRPNPIWPLRVVRRGTSNVDVDAYNAEMNARAHMIHECMRRYELFKRSPNVVRSFIEAKRENEVMYLSKMYGADAIVMPSTSKTFSENLCEQMLSLNQAYAGSVRSIADEYSLSSERADVKDALLRQAIRAEMLGWFDIGDDVKALFNECRSMRDREGHYEAAKELCMAHFASRTRLSDVTTTQDVEVAVGMGVYDYHSRYQETA